MKWLIWLNHTGGKQAGILDKIIDQLSIFGSWFFIAINQVDDYLIYNVDISFEMKL